MTTVKTLMWPPSTPQTSITSSQVSGSMSTLKTLIQYQNCWGKTILIILILIIFLLLLFRLLPAGVYTVSFHPSLLLHCKILVFSVLKQLLCLKQQFSRCLHLRAELGSSSSLFAEQLHLDFPPPFILHLQSPTLIVELVDAENTIIFHHS